MNWDRDCVSCGGEEKFGENGGVAFLLWLGLWLLGETVGSFASSVAVDSWFVKGEGRY